MPNYCDNHLKVIGPSYYATNHFVETNKTKDDALSFSCSMPLPNGLSNTEVAEKWGCKWDAIDSVCEWINSNWVEYSFMSAWSPPIEWLRYVAKIYPTVTFALKYMEPGMDFAGYIVVKGSKIYGSEEFTDIIELSDDDYPNVTDVNIPDGMVLTAISEGQSELEV